MILAAAVVKNVLQSDDVAELTNQDLKYDDVAAKSMDGSVSLGLVQRGAIHISQFGEDIPSIRQDSCSFPQPAFEMGALQPSAGLALVLRMVNSLWNVKMTSPVTRVLSDVKPLTPS